MRSGGSWDKDQQAVVRREEDRLLWGMISRTALCVTLAVAAWSTSSIRLSTPGGYALAATWHVSVAAGGRGDGSLRAPLRDLQAAFDRAGDGDTVRIAPGTYRATPAPFFEDLCGNCENHRTRVHATRGYLVRDRGLTIVGAGADATILVTGAGYGILFLDSPESSLEGVTITGGLRDPDGNATDAGVVARNSRVTITRCTVAYNDHRDTAVVVGIGGIFGREGAELFIHDNRIEDNGWDGVALYRGASAVIADNVIRRGRGAGVGVTWDAQATVLRNDVSEFWKGIGSFGNTRVVARNNRVHHNLGWGIVASGSSFMDATNNAIVRNGNCGMALWGDSIQGRFANNLIWQNGWRKQWVCPCVGIWDYGQPKDFTVRNNLVFGNEAGEYKAVEMEPENPGPPYDLTGQYGNLSLDPHLADTLQYRPLPESPLTDTGDTLLTDPDGSRSDIGVFGGPSARRE